MNEFFHGPTFVMLFEGNLNLFFEFTANSLMAAAGGLV
jgi:hypothetical protein